MAQASDQHHNAPAGGSSRRAARFRCAVAVLAVVSAAGLGAGVLAVAPDASASLPLTTEHSAPRIDPDQANIKGEKVYRGLSRGHTEDPVDYSGGPTPPVGGPHHPTWQNANGDVYTRPVRNEHAVHTLEHGAVWVTYSRSATQQDIRKLRAEVEGVPYRFMSPVPGQDSPVVLTAWGHQLSLPSAQDPRIDAFFAAYVQGPQAPEEGAPVTGGRTQP